MRLAHKVEIAIMLGILVISQNLKAAPTNTDCTINLYTKTPIAKTAYTASGYSISKSIQNKLANDCTFVFNTLSKEKFKAIEVKKLQAKLKKLQAK